MSLRPRTDDDLDLLVEIAPDLDTWEERNPQAPRPLTRDRFDARLAHTADNDGPEAAIAAIRAYEKANFVIEGRQRQHAWVRGTYEDIVRMGILRSEQTPSA